MGHSPLARWEPDARRDVVRVSGPSRGHHDSHTSAAPTPSSRWDTRPTCCDCKSLGSGESAAFGGRGLPVASSRATRWRAAAVEAVRRRHLGQAPTPRAPLRAPSPAPQWRQPVDESGSIAMRGGGLIRSHRDTPKPAMRMSARMLMGPQRCHRHGAAVPSSRLGSASGVRIGPLRGADRARSVAAARTAGVATMETSRSARQVTPRRPTRRRQPGARGRARHRGWHVEC